MVNHHVPNLESLLPEISAIAFASLPHDQQLLWKNLLQRIFDPLAMQQETHREEQRSGIFEEGLHLRVPACGGMPAHLMQHARRGARLFSTRDAELSLSLCHLLEQAINGRNSYDQGVTQERLRIGRGLHDNIGARLLKLIHHLRGSPSADIARDAMKDFRTAIAAMDSRPVPLSHALADWCAEAYSRCRVSAKGAHHFLPLLHDACSITFVSCPKRWQR